MSSPVAPWPWRSASRFLHIAVSGVRVRIPSGGYTPELGHLPLSEDALRRSITTKVRDGATDGRGSEGYDDRADDWSA